MSDEASPHVDELIGRAGTLERAGHVWRAIGVYEEALRLEERTEILLHVGNLYNDVGRLDDAIRAHGRVLERSPDLPGGHHGLGLAYYRSARVKEAIGCFERVVALDPGWVTARYWLGLAHYHRGDLEEAIAAFRALLDVSPGFTIAWYHLGTAAAIIEHVWDISYDPMTNIVDAHIRALRAKIDQDFSPPLIATVCGAGYMLEEPETAA